MRFFTLLLLFCSLHAFPAQPLHAEEVNVILIGGQSNATGQGYVRNIPDFFKTDERVLLYYSGALKGTEPAEQLIPLSPASESPDRFGVELSLGTALQKKFPRKKWAIIKHALSGSNLFRQWNPGKTLQDKPGEEYVQFIQTVHRGLEALKKQGHTPVLKAMAWQQGEGDARDIAGKDHSRAYGENLHNLINRIRADLKAPDLLFIYGSILPAALPSRFPGRDEVRRGQREVAENARTALSVKNAIYVPADDLQLRSMDFRTPFPTDQIHLGTHGILTLGERFAAALEKAWKQNR
ncbi:sialate O-acetylesterase [uncultured Akkermansia sp.]|uniref:sialate O-acetylesterase n=1 Tax=uncultured Akkermansia sp. TaxID=512294 RepID=UPI00265CA9CD|nr:sialate O-acetylesterase [uncultured Akkermansia sp.]